MHFEHFQKRDDPHSESIFEVTDSETNGLLNVKKVLFQRTL